MALSRNARLRPTTPDAPDTGDQGASISVIGSTDDPSLLPQIDPSGAVSVPTEDGGVVIDFAPKLATSTEPPAHFDNLAERLEPELLNRIIDDVLRGVQSDLDSRVDWEAMREEGVKMLGTRLEAPYAPSGDTTQPFEGMARIRHPLLIEAIARFQATAAAELYPPSGPVKVRDDRPSQPEWVLGGNAQAMIDGLKQALAQNNLSPEQEAELTAYMSEIIPSPRDEKAEALEKGFNHNLTVVDRGYRPDSVRMLFSVAFDGCAFKKVYDCPIKQRPVSRFVQAKDIIVSNAASHERDAGRITHRISMDRSVLKVMEIRKVYRKGLSDRDPTYQEDRIKQAEGQAQGLTTTPPRREDQPFTFYETYLDLDLPGFEDKDKDGNETGLPRPYRITIERDNRFCVELRRNWEEDDETFQPRHCLVKFGFIPALGFYDIGLLHLLGNGDRALTAAWRLAIDTAMFGNFPGFIYNEGFIKSWTNQNRVPPGGGIGIKGIGNLPLSQVLMPIPYKDLGQGLVALIQHLEQRMDRVAGTGEIQVAEGRQDAPVGTTLALIEQATKVLAAVHIGLHASCADELQLLKDRYARNPASFWKWQKKRDAAVWEPDLFLKALEDNEIVPASDVNTPSHMMRIMRAWSVLQLAQTAPGLFKPYQAARRFLEMIGVPDPDEILDENYQVGGAEQPQADPNRMAAIAQKSQQAQMEAQGKLAEIQAKGQEAVREHIMRMTEQQQDAQNQERDRQMAGQEAVVESADRSADRASRERIALTRLQAERQKLASQERQTQTRETGQQQRHAADVWVRPHIQAAAQFTPGGGGLAVPPPGPASRPPVPPAAPPEQT